MNLEGTRSSSAEGVLMKSEPKILVIFGSTGDLIAKKVLPALNQWYEEQSPYDQILCLGRRPFSVNAYKDFIEAKGQFQWQDALKDKVAYMGLEFNHAGDYQNLKDFMEAGSYKNITFYLAVKPEAFVKITENLSQQGLLEKGNPRHKIIFEKPFGGSLRSSQNIQKHILALADEEQIYRIDHYLGKDMIRNILALRFGNRLFQESWNGSVISSVKIISSERAGVEERLDYYDHAGAINDMIQSHLLQLVALMAMDEPTDLRPENIRKAKYEVLKHIELSETEPVLRGQYEGYRQIDENLSQSETETYVKAILSIHKPNWKDTQFIVETGKKMKEKRIEIVVTYKPKVLRLSESEVLPVEPNVLTIQVYPSEGVHLRFNSKAPGYDFQMDPVHADYCHDCRILGNKPEAYVKLLMDAEAGDKTLFASWKELEIQWKIADQIKAAACQNPLLIYAEDTL